MTPLKIFAQLDPSFNPFPVVQANSQTTTNIFAIVLNVVGAIALLIIVLASYKYILSMGEPEKVSKAKNTIIYAAVGLAVTVAAAAIVSVVLGQLII